MKSPSILIIGAGIGGITAGAHLAKQGFQVTILEKNSSPGGRCSKFEDNGHVFDVGPTLLVMPKIYEEEFSRLGEDIHQLLDLRRVDPTYHVYFDDGSKLALTSDLGWMETQLEAIEPGSFKHYLEYISEGSRHYKWVMNSLVNRDFRSILDFIKPEVLPALVQIKPLTRHYSNVGTYFDDPRLKAAFTFQDMYVGLSPVEAIATFSLLQYTEMVHGVWFPIGGMHSVVQSLVSIAKKWGCEFHYDYEVKSIDVNGHRVNGVTLSNGEVLEADIVLANADLPYVYQSLLPENGSTKRLLDKEFSNSTVTFYWGMDKAFEQLPPHALFLAQDYIGTFETIFEEFSIPENPSLYIHTPTKIDPAQGPPGQETITAIIPLGHINETKKQDWDEICSKARQAVLRRLGQIGIHDFEESIKVEHCVTPLDWRGRFNLVKGATHGLSHTIPQMAYFRPNNRHHDFRNLYFVGASTHPGTGIPNALISARLVSERIVEDLARNVLQPPYP